MGGLPDCLFYSEIGRGSGGLRTLGKRLAMNQEKGGGLNRLACLLIILAACASGFCTPAAMNYQAKLTNADGTPVTTVTNLTFTFWDSESGGIQLGDGYSDLDAVTPGSTGIVSTLIGDDPGVGIPASVFASDSVWLNVNVNGTDLVPRERISSVGYAINALPLYGQAHIIPDVTSNASVNGLNLLAAIARAKTLTPNSQPLSAGNRAVVLVAPGPYDIGTTEVLLDTEFVDLVGLSTSRADQHIKGLSNGPGFGVLHQTANDIHIENLLVECTRTTGGLVLTSQDPAAYFPDASYPATVVRNCQFKGDELNAKSTRLESLYSGTYTDCVGGDDSFGGTGGIANGTFMNCKGGDYAFGGFIGAASGTFTNCSGGTGAFGGGPGGVASGVFANCTGGAQAFGGMGVLASGSFTNCTGGIQAFGAVASADGGRFHHCSGGTASFTPSGTPMPFFQDCTLKGKPFLSNTDSQVVAPVTDDAAYNGAILLLAYQYAAALRPNGQDLSTTNRATLILPPGVYDMGVAQFQMYEQFVDVTGQTALRNNQRILGTANGQNSGVLRQTANDVHIENLVVECTRSTGGLPGPAANDPAAYFPDTNLGATVVNNCEFRADSVNAYPMRRTIAYAGRYVDSAGGELGFGGGGGTASGTFIRCTSGGGGFGAFGTASGTFKDCSSGIESFGTQGTASGTFDHCTAGDTSFGALGSAAGGKFLYCSGGPSSFTVTGAPLVLYCVRNGAAYP